MWLRYHYLNGNVYQGLWLNDKKHGTGSYYYAESKESYEGEWQSGMRNGRGVFKYVCGVYEG